MAGIWDERQSGDEIKHTFSIVTTTPNREMSELPQPDACVADKPSG